MESDLEFKLRVLNREIEKVSEVGRRLTSAEALNLQDFQAILEEENAAQNRFKPAAKKKKKAD